MQLKELGEILDRYLSGTATKAERRLIENYWAQSGNEEQLKLSGEEKSRLAESIWEGLLLKSARPQPRVARLINRRLLLQAASVAILLSVAGMFSWQYIFKGRGRHNITYTTIIARAGKVLDYTLPDSSLLHIFPGSEIQVPDNFNQADRRISVNGKVFFEVRPDEARPFYAMAGALQTQVLGTSFEVNTFHHNRPAVTVRSGRVGVSYQGKQLSQLGVNDQLRFNLPTGDMQLLRVNAAEQCDWWNGQLSFEHTPLPEVLEHIEKWFGVDIVLQGERLREETVTTSFGTDASLPEVLSLLTRTLDGHYEIKDREILIY